jgi:hypothetical protein
MSYGIGTSNKTKYFSKTTLNELMKNIVIKNGYYRNNRYVVLLPKKYVPGGGSSDNKKTVFMNCSSATVPGVNFSVVERREAAQTFKVPFDHTVNNLTFRFYCSESFVERKYFEFWFDDIFDPVYRCYKYFSGSSSGEYSDKGYGQNFDIVLLSDLASGMMSGAASAVSGDDRAPLEILHVKIFDAFPINLSDVNVSYETVDTIGTFDVQICFLRHATTNKENFVDSDEGFKELYFKSLQDFSDGYGSSLSSMSSDGISSSMDSIMTDFESIIASNINNYYNQDVWSSFGSISSLTGSAMDLISNVSNVYNSLSA